MFVFACPCENHRIRGVSEGRSRLRHGACAQRPTLKAGLCLIKGICFSVGLYMVAPRLAEGPCAMWQISAEDGDASGRARRGRERERYGTGEGFWGQERLEASVIRIIAVFLVLVSASPVFARRPHIQIQARSEWHSSLLCLNLANSSNPNLN